MNDDTNQVLTRAYELIEAEHLDEAKALLEPVVTQEKDNADAWWLYAHAVTDTTTARSALQNVLRIDPAYPDANELLRTMDEPLSTSSLRPIARIDAQPSPVTLPNLPSTLPEKVDEVWEMEDAGQGDKSSQRILSTRSLAVLIPIAILVVVGGLLLILNSANPAQINTPTSTPLEQVSVSTLSADVFTPLPLDTVVPSNFTEEALPVPPTVPMVDSESIATSTPFSPTMDGQLVVTESASTGDPYQPIYEVLGHFTLPRNSIEITDTGLGSTLLVSICTVAGPELRAALPSAMSAIATVSDSLEGSIEAIGTRMLNCGNNSTLLIIGVAREDAVAYANGQLTDEEFQALWRSQ
jgi:hypothetical protein